MIEALLIFGFLATVILSATAYVAWWLEHNEHSDE